MKDTSLFYFRHADPRYPFLWETSSQPPARWHGPDEGPTHYFADTPDGAWAEFLRHENITDADDLAGIERSIWAVQIPHLPRTKPSLTAATVRGGLRTYTRCQAHARELRRRGVKGLVADSAALKGGGAHGWRVAVGLEPGPAADGKTIVLFGPRPDLIGWRATSTGRPAASLLIRVRYL